jgi:hypothetical protein
MNHQLVTKTALGAALAGIAILATSTASATPMNSIADSWHNLGANNSKNLNPNGTGTPNMSNATGEICVFCHTPHGGDTSAAVPIWNRVLSDPADYQGTRYSDNNTTTFDAEEGPIGSVTIACLSCHDGAQAVDALINAPGSGNYTPLGSPAADFYAWAGTDRFSGTDTDGAGKLNPNIVQNLGTDLRNDHPVSMQYAGGGITGSLGAITNGVPVDRDFTTETARDITLADGNTYKVSLAAEQHATLDTVFWIERGNESLNAAGRDREDVIFYTRDFAPTVTANGNKAGIQPFVECGSCHDPHNVSNPTFLRVSNGIPSAGTLADTFPTRTNDAASGLCLTCHDK